MISQARYDCRYIDMCGDINMLLTLFLDEVLLIFLILSFVRKLVIGIKILFTLKN